jgi:hypothetical protein
MLRTWMLVIWLTAVVCLIGGALDVFYGTIR